MTATITLLQPTKEDLQYRYGLHAIAGHYGSWNKFLVTIGELDSAVLYPRDVNKEILIENFYRLKTELGRTPKQTDLGLGRQPVHDPTITDYKRTFGSWRNFLTLMGEDVKVKPRTFKGNSTKDELISQYYKIKQDIGRLPRLKDWVIRDRQKHDVRAYQCVFTKFGSWATFQKQLEPESAMIVTKKCKICSKEFKVDWTNPHFYRKTVCSEICNYQRKQIVDNPQYQINPKCRNCDNLIDKRKLDRRSVFCSESCMITFFRNRDKKRHSDIIKVCPHCKNGFITRQIKVRYCSKICRIKSWRLKNKQKLIDQTRKRYYSKHPEFTQIVCKFCKQTKTLRSIFLHSGSRLCSIECRKEYNMQYAREWKQRHYK